MRIKEGAECVGAISGEPSNDWPMSSNGLTQPPATAMQRNLAMHNSAVESGSRRKDTDEWLGSRRSRMLDWRQPPSGTPTIGDNIGDNLPPSHQPPQILTISSVVC